MTGRRPQPRLVRQSIDIANRAELVKWLDKAVPGEVACYHIGRLAEHRMHLFWPGKEKQHELHLLAGKLLRYAEAGRVHLVQEKCTQGFRYYAIKARIPQTGREIVREALA